MSSLTVPELKLVMSVFYCVEVDGRVGKGTLVTGLENNIKANPSFLDRTLDEYLSRNEPGARRAEAMAEAADASTAQQAQQRPEGSVLDANLSHGMTANEMIAFFRH